TAAGFVTYYHVNDPALAMSLMEDSVAGPANAAAFAEAGIEAETSTRDYKGNKILRLNYAGKLPATGDAAGA
ncbi:MAG: hypothetical protein GWN81_24800, partial [Phycisphaerae bacterium]|nr:hypothetical protein [Phycisphaerae bacterium]